MQTKLGKTAFLGIFLLAWIAVLGVPGSAAQSVPERFTATLVNPGDVPARTTTSAPVVLQIDRYSTDAEVQRLADVLNQKGPDALRDALWDNEVGYIRVGGGLGYPLGAVRSRQTERGRTIYILIDRPFEFGEFWASSRSLDYPFGFIQIDLGPDGKGEGRFYPAAKIRLTDRAVDVEGYHFQPARLLNVTKR